MRTFYITEQYSLYSKDEKSSFCTPCGSNRRWQLLHAEYPQECEVPERDAPSAFGTGWTTEKGN